MTRDFSFGRFMAVILAAAVLAIGLSLAFLSAEPGRMPLSEILATVFGVGLTIVIAGALSGLMFFSSRSGRDDDAGRGSGHR